MMEHGRQVANNNGRWMAVGRTCAMCSVYRHAYVSLQRDYGTQSSAHQSRQIADG